MSEREVRADPRMTEVEALMWTLDADPHLSATFANVTLLDRPIDRERFRNKLVGAVAAVPRLRQRVVPAIGRLAPPSWEDDPDFDLDRHLQWTTLPDGAGTDEVLAMAARLHAEPFDRDRPLWLFLGVDGLSGGRAAMIQKLHHTVTDGVGGLRLAERFIDLERDPADDGRPDRDHRDGAAPAPGGGGTGLVGRTLGTVGHVGRQVAGTTADLARGAVGTLAHPETWPDLAVDATQTARSLARQVVGTDRARSPLWTDRSLQRRLEVLRVPFAAVKETAAAHDATVNDVFVTAAARAAAQVHRDAGQPVEELRMAMPVSTRDDATAAGNAFAVTRCLVPVAVEDPTAHLRAVHAVLGATRDERAFQVLDQLAGVVNVLPTAALVSTARRQAETVDFTTSNLRGAPFPVYFGGARVVENYPVGPLAGTAFNLTMLSYDGELHLGLLVDPAAVEDPVALRKALAGAFTELTT